MRLARSNAWNGGAITILFILLVVLPLLASAIVDQHGNRRTDEDRGLRRLRSDDLAPLGRLTARRA
jgi:hypothetical protein